jgi:tetrahydromethanopterin S-methyltransferase subunit G
MTAELIQTLVNAALLIGVTLIAGGIGLKRFEAIERRLDRLETKMDDRFEAVDRRFEAVDRRFDTVDDRFEALRAELSHDIAVVDGHVGEVRAELVQTRSDLTYVALAVGAHRTEGSA